MAQVSVTIAGRAYRMACEDGQEPHLEALARHLDQRIGEMRTAFGEIGDQRLIVMAAIAIADEMAELKKTNAAMTAQIAEFNNARAKDQAHSSQVEDAAARALEDAAQRIEAMAKTVNAAGRL